MKKRIILGSIFAVAILIFLSFTNVVGHRNNSSDSVEKSPLFSIRTKRAIEQENNPYSSEYIGKGKEIDISIPKRNKNSMTIIEIIDKIANMDDKSYHIFISRLIPLLNRESKLSDYKIQKTLSILNQIRDKPELMKNLLGNGNDFNDKYPFGSNLINITVANCPTINHWVPGCFLFILIAGSITWIGIILFIIILSIPTLYINTCGAFTCQQGSFCWKGNCVKS